MSVLGAGGLRRPDRGGTRPLKKSRPALLRFVEPCGLSCAAAGGVLPVVLLGMADEPRGLSEEAALTIAHAR